MAIFCRLVKAGYGTIRDVKEMGAREVIQAIHYEAFCDHYETAYMEMNK